MRPTMRRLAVAVGVAVAGVLTMITVGVPAASAHVVPTSSVQLQVGETAVVAAVAVPVSDVAAATGLDLGDGSPAEVAADANGITAYLRAHVAPTTDAGQPWTVGVGPLTVATTGDAATTGRYQQLQTVLTLTPPDGAGVRSFNLGYDAVVERVATHVVVVTLASDWSGGEVTGSRELGVVKRDTVSGAVQPLHVDLGAGSELRGFASMIALGVQHIQQGTDHQLFLLTLLLPAPLLAERRGPGGRRWDGAVPARQAVRRIATITLSFTLGHSVTLALGTLGVPAPQRLVEAAIALSILVAAAHAVRPLFPGREAVVAAFFGLVHGLAFATTLRELSLSGRQLALSLLGFNLGIELMQLIVVALVLPPLVLLARAGRYRALRVVAAVATGAAALGWLGARLGLANPVADLADRLGVLSIPVVGLLWATAVVVHRRCVSRQQSRTCQIPVESGLNWDLTTRGS